MSILIFILILSSNLIELSLTNNCDSQFVDNNNIQEKYTNALTHDFYLPDMNNMKADGTLVVSHTAIELYNSPGASR